MTSYGGTASGSMDWHRAVYGARGSGRHNTYSGRNGYDDDDGFIYGRFSDDDDNDRYDTSHGRSTISGGTSQQLRRFMRERETARAAQSQSRQLALLKEIDAMASTSDGDGRPVASARGRNVSDANQGSGSLAESSRHMPIGSVALRPELNHYGSTWLVRLHLSILHRGLSYVIKNIPEFIQAVREREFRTYGRGLAFMHTRDMLDTRSQTIFDIMERAVLIREAVSGRNRRGEADTVHLTDVEVCDILDAFVDGDGVISYERPYRMQPELAKVMSGDPDLGLALEREGEYGYVIRHRMDVLDVIGGGGRSYVAVAPTVDTIMESVSRQNETTWGDEVRIYRCSHGFAAARDAINALCGTERGDAYLSDADAEMFMRTVVPLLTPVADEPVSGEDEPVGGVPIRLPAELLRLRREPCVIEIYLDRDRAGVTCDVRARYGDRRYHALTGTSEDAALRDRDAERLAVEAVLHYFPRPSGPMAVIAESDDQAIWRLLTEGLPVLRGLGEVYTTAAFDGLSTTSRPIVRLGLSIRSGLVEISPIADEVDPKDVAGVLAAYRRHRRFHRLSNGAFVDLRDMDTQQAEETLADVGLTLRDLEQGPVAVPAYSAYYLDSRVAETDKSDEFRAYCENLRVVDPRSYTLPTSFAGVLRPYQETGFRWLSAAYEKGFGGILADEMGLGKTVQLLALLAAHRDEAQTCGPALIVCPASLVYNWESECRRFVPELDVAVIAGAKTQRSALLDRVRGGGDAASPVPDVMITSYDLLRRDVDEYRGLTFHCMVLDEAQYVKNHATKVSKAVRSVDARHRFALTGTPIENRLAELWSIFDFLMPGMLGSYRHFRDRFEQPILSGDEDAQARLQALVGPFILRRLKADVLKDLPDKIENVIRVPLQGEQRRLYAALEQRLRASINHTRDVDFGEERIRVLAQLTRLRQVCCDPRLAYEQAEESPHMASTPAAAAHEVAERRAAPRSAKLDAIEELVTDCRDAGRKVLVFSQFTSYLDLIAERLRKDGIAYDVITGATPKRKRLELVDSFNHDDTPVFLISLKAGNTGLNLTGACVVIHADPWWNAAAQEQATDRAHRIGQTQDVNVYQIVAKDTIEERILDLQRSKTDLARRFVDHAASATGASIASLTRDDLLSLLGA